MTKVQRTILIILSAIAVLLLLGLIILNRVLSKEEQTGEPLAVQVAEITFTPHPTGTPLTEQTATSTDATVPVTGTVIPTTNPTAELPNETQEPSYVFFPTAEPAITPIPTVPNGMAFTLSILGKAVSVAGSVDEDTLEQSPGWLPNSAKPGQEGTCVVYGHRNRNHLLILKEIEVGDEIDVIMPSGTIYTYVVDKTEILDSEESLHIPTTEGKHLILMTCYPFHYTGHAPQKFVVVCVLQNKSSRTK